MAARHSRQHALAGGTCPTCGRPWPARSHRFPHVRGPVSARLVELIADNPGINGRELMRKLYADDPDGGPDNLKIIGVLVFKARQRLRLDGYWIESSTGRGGGYRIRELRP